MQIKKTCNIVIAWLGMTVLSVILLSACFTGVEGTKKISLSGQEKKLIEQTPEDTFLNFIKPESADRWVRGKRFVALDNRTALIFDNRTLSTAVDTADFKGRILQFTGLDSIKMPGNEWQTVLLFASDNGNSYRYNTGVTDAANQGQICSDAIPMMVDMDIIETLSTELVGKSLWTRSSLWYDADGNLLQGKRYVKVNVTSIEPGIKVFPLKVNFITEDGTSASMYMNTGSTALDSRSFPTLFALSDPKTLYPGIETEVWALIQNGNVREGMTKEECRLSLGAPSEVSATHNTGRFYDIWKYTDGSYYLFEDGLLKKYHR